MEQRLYDNMRAYLINYIVRYACSPSIVKLRRCIFSHTRCMFILLSSRLMPYKHTVLITLSALLPYSLLLQLQCIKTIHLPEKTFKFNLVVCKKLPNSFSPTFCDSSLFLFLNQSRCCLFFRVFFASKMFECYFNP